MVKIKIRWGLADGTFFSIWDYGVARWVGWATEHWLAGHWNTTHHGFRIATDRSHWHRQWQWVDTGIGEIMLYLSRRWTEEIAWKSHRFDVKITNVCFDSCTAWWSYLSSTFSWYLQQRYRFHLVFNGDLVECGRTRWFFGNLWFRWCFDSSEASRSPGGWNLTKQRCESLESLNQKGAMKSKLYKS